MRSVARQAHWDKYEYCPSPAGKRTPIDESTHQCIFDELLKWQSETGSRADMRPQDNAWYWDLRCQMIDEQKLTVFHCWDACRNSIRNQLAKKFPEAAAKKKSASG